MARTRRQMMYEEPHAIEIVSKYAEKRCATCAHFRSIPITRGVLSVGTATVCLIKPAAKKGNKTGYRGVVKDVNVCDLLEEK